MHSMIDMSTMFKSQLDLDVKKWNLKNSAPNPIFHDKGLTPQKLKDMVQEEGLEGHRVRG